VQIRFDSSTPIYLQIIDETKRALARGELLPGDRVPAQRDLAKQIKVNPNTVQRAYREMEVQGIVETRRGEGTFTTTDARLIARLKKEMAEAAAAEFLRSLRALGYSEQEARDFTYEKLRGEEVLK